MNNFNSQNIYNNQNSFIPSTNDILQYNYKNEKLETKSKLRKKAINKILMNKTVVFVEEITKEKLDEIEQLNYDKQFEIIKSHLTSNNEQNMIKILSYIINTFCHFPGENKIKTKIVEKGIIDIILMLFYTTNNKDIFSLCSSIISNFCADYILFSLRMLNEDGIKKIYNDLQNKYFNNPYIISNCITCYKESLDHLIEMIKEFGINEEKNIKYISYTTKRLLCNLTNWILYNKELFISIPQAGMQSFFKLIELLITSISVPNQYDMIFDLDYSNNIHFENLIYYILSMPLKDLEYDTVENYLLLLIEISKNETYLLYLTKKYNNMCIFDVIKKLFGYSYLDNNSTEEERKNNPVLDSIFIKYCLEILANLIKETINNDDMINLFLLLFKNHRGTVRYAELVPLGIMEFLLKLSENIDNNKKISDIIFSTQNNIINDCIKFYIRNNQCYVLVMQFLLNIFEYKDFNDIENVNFNNVIKCFVDGLDSKEKEVYNKSVYCLGKLIEIQNKKHYNFDLLLKYEENHVIEKLNLLSLNKNNQSISEEENAEILLKYIESKIKESEK